MKACMLQTDLLHSILKGRYQVENHTLKKILAEITTEIYFIFHWVGCLHFTCLPVWTMELQ